MLDAFVWVHENGERFGWDGERVSIGGSSSGSQVAFAVVEQAIDAGGYLPVAISSEFGVGNVSRPDEQRTSAKARPVVPPALIRLVRDTYFAGTDLSDPLVSTAYYPRLAEFPPTLVMTAELDTLRDEMNELAADLARKGVQVTHKQFAGVDHGFTHAKPVEVAREALRMIAEHLRKAYEVPTKEERNVAVVRSFIDGAINGGDLAVIDATWADDMIWDRRQHRRHATSKVRPSQGVHQQRHQRRPVHGQPRHRHARRMARHRHLHRPRRPHRRSLVRRGHPRHVAAARRRRLAGVDRPTTQERSAARTWQLRCVQASD